MVFIESICNDQELVRRNIIAVRRSSPEYSAKPGEEAERDFRSRIDRYTRVYQVRRKDGKGGLRRMEKLSLVLTAVLIARYNRCW